MTTLMIFVSEAHVSLPTFVWRSTVWAAEISKATGGRALATGSGWYWRLFDAGRAIASMIDTDEHMGVLSGDVDEAARLLATTREVLTAYASARARFEPYADLDYIDILELEIAGSLPPLKAFDDDEYDAADRDGFWSFLRRIGIDHGPPVSKLTVEEVVGRAR